MTHRLALLTAAALMPIAPAAAQVYGAPPPFRSLTVPCSATPTFDLSAATAFYIVLCSTPGTAVFTNTAKAAGRPVSVVVCQDGTGGRTFAYPNTIFGAAPISSAPSICTAQTFIITNGQVFATSSGAQQANFPVPSLFAAPFNSMTYEPTANGIVAVANELTGVALTFNSAVTQSQFNGKFNGYGKANSGTGTVVVTVSFYIDQPDKTGTNIWSLGTNGSNGTNSEYCGYFVGPSGLNRVGHHYYGTFDNTVGETIDFGGTYFDSPSRQLYLKYQQLLGADNTAHCSYSSDGGSTWHDFAARSHNNSLTNAYWSLGASDFQKNTGAKMHITSLAITQVP